MSITSYLKQKYNYQNTETVPTEYVMHELLLQTTTRNVIETKKKIRTFLGTKHTPKFLEFSAFCKIVETFLLKDQ